MRIARSTPAQKPRGAAMSSSSGGLVVASMAKRALRDCSREGRFLWCRLSGLRVRGPLFRLKGVPPVSLAKLAVPALILLAAGGCSRTGDIAEGGITAVRSACPHVGVPAGTGDVTLFN